MKCENCGTEFNEGVFCPECGMRIESDLSPEERTKKQEEEEIAKEKAEKEEKEKRELELAKQKTEQERIAKERAEKEAEASRAKLELERIKKEKKGDARETIALVFGIISILTCGSFILPGVIAIVCALQCKVNGKIPSRAKTGMTCGIIGLTLFGLCFLLLIVMAAIES